MTFDEWLAIGRQNKWVSEPVCDIHGDFPMTRQEVIDLDEGEDNCFHVLRLYEKPEHCDEAEEREERLKRSRTTNCEKETND